MGPATTEHHLLRRRRFPLGPGFWFTQVESGEGGDGNRPRGGDYLYIH